MYNKSYVNGVAILYKNYLALNGMIKVMLMVLPFCTKIILHVSAKKKKNYLALKI